MAFFFFIILWELNLDMTETLSEVTLLAGTIFGEADDQEYAGKVGVGLTVATRVKYPRWWGRNWRQVILMPHQFTCWEDKNKGRIFNGMNGSTEDWKVCFGIARSIYLGEIEDKLGKPTHYHRFDIKPKWVDGLDYLCRIGDHIFYHDPAIDKE